MEYPLIFNAVLIYVVVASIIWVVVKTFKINVPVKYGRHEGGDGGLRLPTRLSWILMESPACLVFAWFIYIGDLDITLPVIVLFIFWQAHYFHRSFIYPFRLAVRPGATTPLRITVLGAIMCTLCGYTNGTFIASYAPHLQSNEWFYMPQFIIGTLLFLLGYAMNKYSDRVLIKLRKANPDAYSIPHGGVYSVVSCPNYLGEIITWLGFSIAAWSIAGFVFTFMTACNLIYRGIENHQWYLDKFPEYPKDRKAVIPFIL